MQTIDVRFSEATMKTIQLMLGHKVLNYMCDPFYYSTSVYGAVGICLKNQAYEFTNFTEVMDHYGTKEDVAIFRMAPVTAQDIHSRVEGETMISTPVNEKLVGVQVINEHQKLFEEGIQTFDVRLTRGIIFFFESGLELSLEKNVWFSEDISVERGYDLLKKFTPVEEFVENWEDEFRGECSREVIDLKAGCS